ncbi:class I SAM-dependent methyltransferase [Anaerofustis stercorihominis]|uniref:class I SAM-dependent methyltransferase n=1 Tax=Anaerofustis stercorihominis TaxID=214853 RepID=UPI0011073293|nr:class I SAM-dependent methyltransferase [Anaerofustis stercorihominis]
MKDIEELSRTHFNKQAKDYDKKNTIYYSKEGKISCNSVSAYLNNLKYDNILDVGCGTGFLFENLKTGQNYFGIDISENMIKVAKSKNIPNTYFSVGTSNKLDFKDEFFHIVTCIQSFHHYPYQEEAMKEAYRVLKKGGLYILSDTGVGGIPAFIDNHFIFPFLKSGDYKTTNKKGIEKMMIKCGFTIIESKKEKGFIYTVIAKK